MIRFAWLQSRTQTLTTLAALAVVAVVAAVTGVQLSHLYHSLVAPCAATGDCGLAAGRFHAHYTWLQNGFELVLRLAPAIVGIFWGAPLVARELETGTYRLAWTQGVTRCRWLTTRLLLVGASAVAAAGLLTLITTWWFRAVDAVGTNQWDVFDRRDLVPVAYAVFAFALGVFVGTVIRRTLPAMAATLGIFAFTRIAITSWVRPHLLTPLHTSMSLLSAGEFGFTLTPNGTVDLAAGGPSIPNAWVQSSRIVTSTGQTASAAERAAFVSQNCPTIAHPPSPGQGRAAGDTGAFDACRQQAARVFHITASYQPAGRYWTFQWLEAAIYVALALVALIGSYWWIHRRAN
jgi:ABC-type transport system involved in multi-copper enzyme maturation permease subunit